MNDIGLFSWIGIALGVIILVALLFLAIRFVVDYYGTKYEYKGKQYQIIRTGECKDRSTGDWYDVIIYKNKQRQVFVREQKDFLNKFVPVNRNK